MLRRFRNSVYAGPFNNLLLELSRDCLFTEMWDIPPLEENENSEPSARLRRNVLYRQMRDAELVLRVFGLLHPKYVRGGMRSTLDKAMEEHSKLPQDELVKLKAKIYRLPWTSPVNRRQGCL